MEVNSIKLTVCGGVGAVGAILANAFGGWSEDLITLIILMAVDYATGLIVAGVFNKSSKSDSGALSSNAGWKGLCRKGVTLLFVLVANRLDITLGVEYIKTSVVIAFITNEALSIIENAGLMGIGIPEPIARALELLKNKEDGAK